MSDGTYTGSVSAFFNDTVNGRHLRLFNSRLNRAPCLRRFLGWAYTIDRRWYFLMKGVICLHSAASSRMILEDTIDQAAEIAD